MSNSVVPAAAVAHAKQLVKNKKLTKRTEDQKPAQDEQQAADHNPDAANAVQVERADHAKSSMSATSMSGDFSFGGALSAAADSSASLVAESAQDEGGSVGDDGDGAGGTILLVGAVGLAGLGVAVLAGGGGKSNEAPDITSASTATVAENAAATTVVYTTVATDPDGDTLTYSLTGADAAAFNISAAGVVTLKAPADFEAKSSYSFSVVASDGELTDTQAVTLTVTNVTGATDVPTFTSGTTASIAENSAVTTVVYDANVVGTGATFALTGADAAAFTIDADDGEVRFISSPNFESGKTSYAIGVIATREGGSFTQNVTVNVTDVVEPGPAFTSGTAASIDENSPVSTVVYDANATGTGSITFSLTGADAASFQINSSNGEIRFVNSPDFEADPSYTVTVRATDTNGTTEQNVTINVNNIVVEEIVVSLDQGDPNDDAVALDAGDEEIVFTEDSDEDSNVVIVGFSEDDIIELIGDADLSDYNFGTGNTIGGDANDLAITLNDTGTGHNIILIEDVLVNVGPVFDYETAVEAVGFNFINLG